MQLVTLLVEIIFRTYERAWGIYEKIFVDGKKFPVLIFHTGELDDSLEFDKIAGSSWNPIW